MKYITCMILGYLIGTFNPSFFIAKRRGFDIRTKGSGNAGASNAVILFGKLRGFICAITDIAKAYLALFITEYLFPNFKFAFIITSVFCVIGHIFPFYMKFKGGKGLACLGGMILYFNWKVFLIMLAAEVVIVLVTDYICFVPITASFAFPIVYGSMEGDVWGALILYVITLIIFVKHIENIKRIRQGTEMHISFLWKPEAEMERMKNNISADEAVIEEHFSGAKAIK